MVKEPEPIIGGSTPPMAPRRPPVAPRSVHVGHGYNELADELIAALDQSQGGKGAERHANGKSFMEQPIIQLGLMCGPGGPAQQVMKKTQEALGMHARGQTDAAVRELHGAMVYAAATILVMKNQK